MSRKSVRIHRRVLHKNTNRRLPSLRTNVIKSLLLNTIQDSRRFSPSTFRNRYDLFGKRIIAKPIIFSTYDSSGRYDPLSLKFSLPRSAVTCVRRRVRREVLFANRKAGKVGQRPPKFNSDSTIYCSR